MLVQSRQCFPLNLLRHTPLRLGHTAGDRSNRVRVAANADRIAYRVLKVRRLVENTEIASGTVR